MDSGVLDGEPGGGGAAVDVDRLHDTLEYIRPALQADGGDLVLRGIDDHGIVTVELLGACGTCPLSLFTMIAGVERLVLSRVPGVTGVLAHSPALPEPPGRDPEP